LEQHYTSDQRSGWEILSQGKCQATEQRYGDRQTVVPVSKVSEAAARVSASLEATLRSISIADRDMEIFLSLTHPLAGEFASHKQASPCRA
jgi:hypothetical protein